MKRAFHILYAVAGLSALLLSGCEQELPVYDNPVSYLKFVYDNKGDTLTNFSFAYGPDSVTVDTFHVKLQLQGNLSSSPRVVTLKQFPAGEGLDDAVPGVHYVAFNDAQLANYYILAGDTTTVTVPVILKRDKSLKEKNYHLKFTIASTDVFSVGSKENSFRHIVIADRLIKPNHWGDYVQYFFGDYGAAKHKFLIDVTGKKWDDDYVDNEFHNYLTNDQSYLFWLNQKVQTALTEYNATHSEPLKEADGQLVLIPQF